MAAQVINGIACHAVVTLLLVVVAVLVRVVIVAAARMRRVRLRFAMTEQDRQSCGDTLQRHHGKRRSQDQFLQPK